MHEKSKVPTALLLERPLVMSSMLLDAYPCLRRSRVHSMVSGVSTARPRLCQTFDASSRATNKVGGGGPTRRNV